MQSYNSNIKKIKLINSKDYCNWYLLYYLNIEKAYLKLKVDSKKN